MIKRRHLSRLRNYDYSQAGLYFITICIQGREHLLGEINQENMHLNPAGEMVKKWFTELENKFANILCHEMIIMPNHFHCIFEIKNCHELSVTEEPDSKISVSRVVQWFKTMTSNEYIRGVKQQGWPRFNKRLWQRNYWDHIIRNEEDYINISNYIKNNPISWTDDKLNNDSTKIVAK